jgi:hypothetical protein
LELELLPVLLVLIFSREELAVECDVSVSDFVPD